MRAARNLKDDGINYRAVRLFAGALSELTISRAASCKSVKCWAANCSMVNAVLIQRILMEPLRACGPRAGLQWPQAHHPPRRGSIASAGENSIPGAIPLPTGLGQKSVKAFEITCKLVLGLIRSAQRLQKPIPLVLSAKGEVLGRRTCR
jgi:hypothetical protein